MRRLFAFVAFFISLNIAHLPGQSCGCDVCPVPILGDSTIYLNIIIEGVVNNDLSDPNQGLCKLGLNFQHDRINELEITLTSPAGQTIRLVGPADPFTPNPTPFTEWDVCFIPCSDPPQPDPGIPGQWDNAQFGFSLGLPYTGSYWPFLGCLEDFNTGPVNGTWTIAITDILDFDNGAILDYSLVFCDSAGLECFSCRAASGSIDSDSLEFCQGDPGLLLGIDTLLAGQQTDTAYGYTFLVSRSDSILFQDTLPDLRNEAPGRYEICGLSYLRNDTASSWPPVSGYVFIDSLREALTGVNPAFCGELTNECLLLYIYPDSLTSQRFDTICQGDTLVLCCSTAGDTLRFDASGSYQLPFLSNHGCDSIVLLDLFVAPPASDTINAAICEGGFFLLDQDTFRTTGTYEQLLQDPDGCDSILVLHLEVLAPIAHIGPADTLNCSRTEVILDGSSSSAGPRTTYQWTGSPLPVPSDSLVTAATAAGYFELIVSEFSIDSSIVCMDTASITIAQDTQPPVAVAGEDTVLSCTNDTILLSSAGSSAGPAIQYAWVGPGGYSSDTIIAIATDTGAYVLTVTDTSNGCSASDTVVVGADNSIPQVQAEGDSLSCRDTVARLRALTSLSGLTFRWTGPGGLDTLARDISVKDTGQYILTATTASGCTVSDTATVFGDFTPPGFSLSGDTLSCRDTSVRIQVQPTTTITAYEWSGPGITVPDVAEPLIRLPGWYTLVATGENGCQATDSLQILADSIPPGLSAAGDTLDCQKDTARLSAASSTAGVIFHWSGPGAFFPASDVASPQVEVPGMYVVRATGPNGCISTDSVFVGIDTLAPDADISADTFFITCREPLAMLDGNGSTPAGGIDLRWFGLPDTTLATGPVLVTASEGTYFLEVVRRSNGCRDTAITTVVRADTLPAADAGPEQVITCLRPEVMLDGSASSQGNFILYFWTNTSGDTISTSVTTLVNQPGTYRLTVADTFNGCFSQDSTIVIDSTDLPVVLVTPPDTISCERTFVLLNGSGSSSGRDIVFEWQNTAGVPIGNAGSQQVTQPGDYLLVLRDTFTGCADTALVNVPADTTRPSAVAGAADTLTCSRLEVVLSALGSATGDSICYAWNDANGKLLGDSIIQLVTQAGTYHLEVLDKSNGCRASDSVEVQIDTVSPVAAATAEDTLSCERLSVQLSSAGSMGKGSLSMQWFNPSGQQFSTDSTVAVQEAGEYRLRVIDGSNGCSAETIVFVEADTVLPLASIALPDTLNCAVTSLLLDGSGSSHDTGLTYSWRNISGTELGRADTLRVTDPGIYQLTVTDTNSGCSDTASVEVVLNDSLPLAVASVSDTLSCRVQEVLLSSGGSSQGNAIRFVWRNAGGDTLGQTSSITAGAGGIYILEVFDRRNRCSAFDTVEVTTDTVAPAARVDSIGPLKLDCARNQVVLDASASLVQGNEEIQWITPSGPVDSVVISAAIPGQYTMIAEDPENGCRDTVTAIVRQDTALPVIMQADPLPLTCIRGQILLDAEGSSHGPPFSLAWSGPDLGGADTALVLEVTRPGWYVLTIENRDNSCEVADSVLVLSDTVPPVAQATALGVIGCQQPVVVLSGAGSSMGAGITYEWKTDDGQIEGGADSLEARVSRGGLYRLVVGNISNGCTDTAWVVAEENAVILEGARIDLRSPSCFGERNGSIVVGEVFGGTPPYRYALDDGLFTSDGQFVFLGAGTYRIRVEDAGGCTLDSVVVLRQPDSLLVKLGDDLWINLGESVEITAFVNRPDNALRNVQWLLPPGLNCKGVAECLTITDTPLVQTLYRIEVIDSNGCVATDRLMVRVRKNRRIYFPNAFSPNGDGFNDFYLVFPGAEVVKIRTMRIFDRWGEKVYEMNNFLPDGDVAIAWNGTHNGKLLNPGVFVYVAEVEFKDGVVETFKGGITLIR